jgi:hypothetical protein
VLSFETKLI